LSSSEVENLFIEDIIEGSLSREAGAEILPFTMTISSLRRKKLLEMIDNKDIDSKEMALAVRSYARLLAKKKENETVRPREESNNQS